MLNFGFYLDVGQVGQKCHKFKMRYKGDTFLTKKVTHLQNLLNFFPDKKFIG